MGADEEGHNAFKITRSGGPVLFGDYFEVFEDDGYEFNIEIREFGYVDPRNLGGGGCYREDFSVQECEAVERLVRSFFSDPGVFKGKYSPPLRYLGGVRFRPNWINQEPPDHGD